MATIIRVVLTGGPCGGKTSALRALKDALVSRGLAAYAVPEMPTLVITAGIPYPGTDNPELLLEFEVGLARAQLSLETIIEDLAQARARALKTSGPIVLLLDRSLLDMRGYMSEDVWTRVLSRLSVDEAVYRSGIQLVLHLQTTAEGAMAAYSCSNNAARSETAAEAREADAAVWRAYDKHPKRVLVLNPPDGGFPEKLKAAETALCATLDEILSAASTSL
jgi:predicted ATPase